MEVRKMEDKLKFIEDACKHRFKTYKSKRVIIAEEVGDDLDFLFDLVKDNPEEFHGIIKDIKERARRIIEARLNVY